MLEAASGKKTVKIAQFDAAGRKKGDVEWRRS